MKPFLKWVGSKTQLLSEIKDRMPKEYNRFYEPFVGAGSVCFELMPRDAVINDFNKELINCYEQIRDNPREFCTELKKYDEKEYSKDVYYSIREKFNAKILQAEYDIEMAVLFVYLNKRAWNGVYRINSKGLFNVPWNQKETQINSFNEDNIFEISEYLRYNDIHICSGDFEKSLIGVTTGDFVFMDPPYVPVSDTANFTDYQKSGFSEENHKRVAKVMRELDKKGVYVMLCNNNVPKVHELYKGFTIEVVDVRRSINRNGNDRKGKEVIIRNYEV